MAGSEKKTRASTTVGVVTDTPDAGVDAAVRAASAAARGFQTAGRRMRVDVLRALADALEDRRADVVSVAARETALPRARLEAELNRTVCQARFFGEVVQEGAFLEVTVDHPGDTPLGPRPDLRRMLLPVGPVAMFSASNFPLAFSVAGGDTVSALAAGCPVVVKAHPSHEELSLLVFGIVSEAAARVGGPDGLLGLVFGKEAGVRLVSHPGIRAVAFTGSASGAQALRAAVDARPDPIPFYGELASLNPVVISEGAAGSRAEQLAAGFVASVFGSAGQLCTKPNVVFVPVGDAGDRLVADVCRRVGELGPHVLLNERIRTSYESEMRAVATLPAVREIATGGTPAAGSGEVAARLFEVAARHLDANLLTERFGPTSLVARYADGDLGSVLDVVPGSLAAAIHSAAGEEQWARTVAERLVPRVGRLVFDEWPTGVHVSWAQHHGGPWPATDNLHTSVGATAIRRFLRPVVWQNAPEALLPADLRDDATRLPRRVDGTFHDAD